MAIQTVVRTMRYRTKLPNPVFCPLGKIVCDPQLLIELSYIRSAYSPIPFKDLDLSLTGFKVATYEEIAEIVATRLAEKYNCQVKVVVGDLGFERFEVEFIAEQ